MDISAFRKDDFTHFCGDFFSFEISLGCLIWGFNLLLFRDAVSFFYYFLGIFLDGRLRIVILFSFMLSCGIRVNRRKGCRWMKKMLCGNNSYWDFIQVK